MSKLYINSKQLFQYSSDLGKLVMKDYKPDAIVGISRGGSYPAIIIHEFLNYKENKCEYYNISCKSYENNKQTDNIFIDMSEHTLKCLQKCKCILIVDDVFDTGLTIMNISNYLYQIGLTSDKFRFATIFYKPNNNKTTIFPDYYIAKTDNWIVFPHEYMSLNDFEVTKKNEHEKIKNFN